MNRKKIITICSILALLFIPVAAMAGFGLKETADAAGLSGYGNSVPVILGNVVGSVLSLIGIVFFILVVYGGFMWMTAGGNQDMVKKAINTIISAAIGLVVVLAAYAITNFALGTLGVGGGGTQQGAPPNPDAACIIQNGTCGTPVSCADGRHLESGLCSEGADNICCLPGLGDAGAPCASDGQCTNTCESDLCT